MSQEQSQPLLRVDSLKKHYREAKALDGVDFSLEQGEFLTLLGPSGSGKTTTLMAIAGFVQPTSGDVQYRGRSIVKSRPEARGFGMVFQGYALFPHMTVRQNVQFPLSVRRLGSRDTAQRIEATLARVQMRDYADRYPQELSGGQQQRVALARALVYEPSVLLLDEPLSALDKKLREDLQWELRNLNKQSAISFLYVTHDQEEAMSMSDRIAIFNHGRIVQIGSPAQLYQRPANLFVAEFLGKSNLFNARMDDAPQDTATIHYEGGTIHVPMTQVSTDTRGAVSLITRPHRIKMHPADKPGIKAKVQAASYVGNSIAWRLTTSAGTPVIVEQVADAQTFHPAQGADVSLELDNDGITILEPRSGEQ